MAGPSTTLIRPEARVKHIAALRPDVCTLDLNTMNSGGQVVINTPENVRRMARIIREAGVKPEIELFDSGDIALLHDLIADETLQIRGRSAPSSSGCATASSLRRRPYSTRATCCLRGLPSPPSALAGTASPRRRRATSPAAMCASASRTASILSRGAAPSNAAMVAKIAGIVEALGAEIASAAEAREMLSLPRRARLNLLIRTELPMASSTRSAALRVEAKAASARCARRDGAPRRNRSAESP